MDSSSVNPLPLKDITEVDSLSLSEEKRSGKTTNHDSHCCGHALFYPVLEHGLPLA